MKIKTEEYRHVYGDVKNYVINEEAQDANWIKVAQDVNATSAAKEQINRISDRNQQLFALVAIIEEALDAFDPNEKKAVAAWAAARRIEKIAFGNEPDLVELGEELVALRKRSK